MNEHHRRADALAQAYLETAGAAVPHAEAAQAFAAFAAARGAKVRLVHGEDGEHPDHPAHTWVRVFNAEGVHGYDVDVAAARFGDPALPAALVWRMDGRHPVTGVHRTLRVTPPPGPGGAGL